jgi:uncharacterized protein with PQ loop repeat
MNSIELFGYAAMIVVLISMLMKDMKHLRIVNTIACSMFVFYGYLLNSYPIIIMNVLVITINVYKLYKGK